ncbi:hypothetical protein ACF073_12625 [Streptomyces sp. NPDC015171]|uniref:hypothetical protein n=1 Tax=Streptomyces sp. NPDC015171 TaxID=3364945 RepID=UPI0036FBB2D0
MTAEHEDARDAGNAANAGRDGENGETGTGEYGEYGPHREYDGMDALMAAITGDPLPAQARRDPAFLAGHRAAEADVALLRDRLAWLAEALTGEPLTGAETAGRESGGPEAARRDTAGEGTAGKGTAGKGAAGSEASGGAVYGEGVTGDGATGGVDGPGGAGPAGSAARRPRSRTRPAGPGRPPRPGRPSGRRRALRIALGSLAGAAAFSLALGLGLLVTRSGGGISGDSAGSAKSAADGAKEATGAAGRPADPERELACSRLVVEGTVARVEPLPDSRASRVTLTVSRSFKPAHGPAEVGFLLEPDVEPAPRAGQHVLVRVARGERYASLWAVGDSRVAAERGWITEAVPGSRDTACPADDGP